MPIEHQIPDDPSAVNTSVNVGIPLVTSTPNTKIARCIAQLAEQLLGTEPEKKDSPERSWLAAMRSSVRLFGTRSNKALTTTNAHAG
jgi:MinD-like ATPase involved in chromosome partitioning or flagellar assembly